jgi:hypothetical protein
MRKSTVPPSDTPDHANSRSTEAGLASTLVREVMGLMAHHQAGLQRAPIRTVLDIELTEDERTQFSEEHALRVEAAARKKRRDHGPGANKGKVSRKTQFFLDLKQQFQDKGPTDLANYISSHVLIDDAVASHFRKDGSALIDRATNRPILMPNLAEQIRKARKRS